MSPTLTGIHHVGIPVPDLDATLAWYEDVLGLRATWVDHVSGQVLSDMVGLPDAELKMAVINVGNSHIGFSQYVSPVGEEVSLRNCDFGVMHVCFEVEDIHSAYEEMLAKGVVFGAPPEEVTEGPPKGSWYTYFRDLNGIQLELTQGPKA